MNAYTSRFHSENMAFRIRNIEHARQLVDQGENPNNIDVEVDIPAGRVVPLLQVVEINGHYVDEEFLKNIDSLLLKSWQDIEKISNDFELWKLGESSLLQSKVGLLALEMRLTVLKTEFKKLMGGGK